MVKFDNQDMFDDQIGFFNILKAAPEHTPRCYRLRHLRQLSKKRKPNADIFNMTMKSQGSVVV
jgi:hypothetical protein